jgi:hypothetical protein
MFADQGAEEVRREVPSGKLVKSAIESSILNSRSDCNPFTTDSGIVLADPGPRGTS